MNDSLLLQRVRQKERGREREIEKGAGRGGGGGGRSTFSATQFKPNCSNLLSVVN